MWNICVIRDIFHSYLQIFIMWRHISRNKCPACVLPINLILYLINFLLPRYFQRNILSLLDGYIKQEKLSTNFTGLWNSFQYENNMVECIDAKKVEFCIYRISLVAYETIEMQVLKVLYEVIKTFRYIGQLIIIVYWAVKTIFRRWN